MAMQMIYGTERADAERLAQRARDEGVRLLRNRVTGEYFASSTSQPGTLHRVSLLRCDCRGWQRYGRCRHQSALLAHFGIVK